MAEGKRRVGCTNHCRACGSHFSSTVAFDAHRQGSHRDGTRHCVEPEDVLTNDMRKRLAPRSVEGFCRVSDPERPQDGVTIWATIEGLERGAEHFAAVA